MIVLKNKGLLEIDLITTMGVHVKETENYIGRFGTGLKYAITVLLRENIDFDLCIGTNVYTFYTQPKTLRGKEFQLCVMSGPLDEVPLPLTTDFGKNWEPWQAYRELFSNCVLDEEEGKVFHGHQSDAPKPEEGYTTLRIYGAIDTNNVFLMETSKQVIYEDEKVEIYEGCSDYLYYQGIRAKDLNKRSKYTYNIKTECDLTEDRSLCYDFQISRAITEALLKMGENQKSLVKDVLNSEQEFFESKLDFTDSYCSPSETFKEVYHSSPDEKRNSTSNYYMKPHLPAPVISPAERRKELLKNIQLLCEEFYGVTEELDSDEEGVVLLKISDLEFGEE